MSDKLLKAVIKLAYNRPEPSPVSLYVFRRRLS